MLMTLQFAGVGSAFTTQEYWQSNMIVQCQGLRMLVDCGSDARFSLKELGYTYKDFQYVYISHLHADHIGGLEWLGFCTYFDPNCDRPVLYIVEDLVDDLWGSLKAGMQSHEGKVLTLSSFFDVRPIKMNDSFMLFGSSFTPVQTVHIMNGFRIMPSYGLFIEDKTRKTFITTDTQFCPNQIARFYEMSDRIFQDCETAPYKSRVHAHYSDLQTLDPKIREKMWLYHYQPHPTQDAKADGFGGFVVKGDKFPI